LSYSDNKNIAEQTDELKMQPPGYLTLAIVPAEIPPVQSEFPPDIRPDRLLKVAGIAHGVPDYMTPEEANGRLDTLTEPPPPQEMAIANVDDPTSQGGGSAPAEAPVNVDVPYVSQSVATLTCTMGNWQGEPTAYSYQWTIDGTAAGTDAPDYAVTGADIGKTASCVVTASNAAGATVAPSSNEVVIA